MKYRQDIEKLKEKRKKIRFRGSRFNATLIHLTIIDRVDSNEEMTQLIKKTFSVATGFDQSDEKEFWLRKSPLERLEAIELMRQILYGYDSTSERLQRIFTNETHLL